MRASLRYAQIGLAAGALVALAACSPPSSNGTSSTGGASAATAKTAADLGGMDALVAAAKKEGTLNVIALPPDWANYGEIISSFKTKYGITVNSANPDGSSQDEVNAVKQQAAPTAPRTCSTSAWPWRSPTPSLFAPYQVATWADIPDSQKELDGRCGSRTTAATCRSATTPPRCRRMTSVADLLKPAYKGKVALNGDPTKANAALNGVMMASLANGGSLDDISKGVDFFHQLKQAGNFVPVQATTATVKNGTTPVVLDWDYLSATHGTDVPTWKIFVPSNAVLGGYYAQAINKDAPHPAAARLWEEYLYSDEGQNLWLKGGARPVRMDAMTKAGTIDGAAAAALPPVTGTPVFLSPDQATAAQTYLAANWAKAIA